MRRNIVFLLVALRAAGGCTSIKPWVSPYERNNLADPIMSFSRDPIASNYLDHVYESRDGARGAEGGAGVVVVAAKRLRRAALLLRCCRALRAPRSFRRIART